MCPEDEQCEPPDCWRLLLQQSHLGLHNLPRSVCPILGITTIWATSWENLFVPYANNKGTDQPVHPRSLISAFVVCCLDSLIPLVSISGISSLYLAPEAEQAGLSLPWSQTPKTGFLMMRLILKWHIFNNFFIPFDTNFKWFQNTNNA